MNYRRNRQGVDRLATALVKTAKSKKDDGLSSFGDVATPIAGAIHPVAGALASGLTDPGDNPLRTGMITGLGSMAGIGGGGVTGGFTGAAIGNLIANLKDVPENRWLSSGLEKRDYITGGARLGALLGALSGGALGSHWTRQVSKDFPKPKNTAKKINAKVTLKKESQAKYRLKEALLLPGIGGGGVLLGKEDIPVQFQAGWGNILGVLPVPEVGVRLGDESKGLSLTGPIPGLSLDFGRMGGSSTYYRPGIPGLISGTKGKDEKLFADDKSKKKKKKKAKKTKASSKGKKK